MSGGASNLVAVVFDAHDPEALARFWGGVLGREVIRSEDEPEVIYGLPAPGGRGFQVDFAPTQEQKVGQNRMHFDLTSATPQEQQATVERALELGGRHIDIGQTADEGHVVLADPEGNEFCVIEAGNDFLADTSFIGAINCDGSQAVGYFWSEALGWPLVWDQDEETAVRSPHGGPKITWGGPPVAPRTGRNRLHFDLAPADSDLQAEVDRLLALGATRTDIGQGEVPWVVLADPDGNEFCVLPPR